MQPCVFFDRDGIVNKSPGPGYVERWEDFHLIPAFVKALHKVRSRNWAAVIVTNQRGIALGCMSADTVEAVHGQLRTLLRDRHGLDVDDILYCPHDRGQCTCRKPQPGMLQTAAKRHGLDLARSWMIGDNEKDVEAGRAAGCRTILVTQAPATTAADYQVPTMEAVPVLLDKLLAETQ